MDRFRINHSQWNETIIVNTPETRKGRVPWHFKSLMKQLESIKNDERIIIRTWDR